MAAKTFTFNGRDVDIAHPNQLVFANQFLRDSYTWVFDTIVPGQYVAQIDADQMHAGAAGFDILQSAANHGIAIQQPTAKASNRDRALTQSHIRTVLGAFPQLAGFFSNTIVSASIAIRNAEFLLGEQCNGGNFILLKKIVDSINRTAWTREQDVSERQSGVSVLGTISETLLGIVMSGMIDNQNFFKIGNAEVQSYGDFVVTCLPNNLWISVKSNFARERLLASGYSNDILGAGFFQDASEFTQPVRIRNFQRAGFLAMYCPDVAVTQHQQINATSTYHEIEEFHRTRGSQMPLNINGKPFIRKLSDLAADIQALLDVADIRRRFTVNF